MKSIPKLHLLLGASLLLAPTAVHAKPVKVFILAGQSNMDGQSEIRTIDFLGEDKDPARAAFTMLELMGLGNKAVPPRLHTFTAPSAK